MDGGFLDHRFENMNDAFGIRFAKFVILIVLLLTMGTIFHEYGHMITADALGYIAEYNQFNIVRVDEDPAEMPQTHYFLIMIMGGIFSSFILLLLSFVLLRNPEAIYFLIFAFIQYITGIGEALWPDYYMIPGRILIILPFMLFIYRERDFLRYAISRN